MKSGVLFSDDHGQSWHVGGHSQVNMTDNEAAISELADGTRSSLTPPRIKSADCGISQSKLRRFTLTHD